MMTPDQIIEVVQAYKDGKTIQYRLHGTTDWRNGEPIFNFFSNDYRVKPEPPEPPKPREFWIHDPNSPYGCEFEKDRILTAKPRNPFWIHVREVIE